MLAPMSSPSAVPGRTALLSLRRITSAAVAGLLLILMTACGSGAKVPPAAVVKPSIKPAGSAGITPRPALARRDDGDVYQRGCSSGYDDDAVHPCVFDYSTGPGAPVVVAAGDSKMAQWVPALQVIAQQQHWKLVSLTKSGCAFSDIHRNWKKKEYTSCVTWNRSAAAKVVRFAPTLLVTTELDFYPTLRGGKVLKGAANRAEMVRGLSSRITTMRRAGIAVATLAETPRMGFDTAACVRTHLKDLDACARPRAQVLKNAGVVEAAAQRSGAAFIDLTSRLCSATTCPAVQGNLLVYRDKHHLTATFARSLAPVLATDLTGELGGDVRSRLFAG